MIDEKSERLREAMARGERASIALNEWKDACEQAKTELREELEATRYDESQKRERLYDCIRAVNHIQAILQRRVLNGENARKELVNLKDKSKLRKIVNG